MCIRDRFKYSERPKTLAARKHEDDVPEDVKGRRLAEIIEAQKLNSAERMAAYVGQVHEVLIEGVSKRSSENMYGRNTQNSVVIVPRLIENEQLTTKELRPGDILKVRIVSATAGSLQGEPITLITELVQEA